MRSLAARFVHKHISKTLLLLKGVIRAGFQAEGLLAVEARREQIMHLYLWKDSFFPCKSSQPLYRAGLDPIPIAACNCASPAVDTTAFIEEKRILGHGC
jgi:hypothetical protein